MRLWHHTVILFILAVLAAIVGLGLWDAHGGLLAFIEGQRPAQPLDLAADTAVAPPAAPPYAVHATIDRAAPLAEVAPEYLSFAIDTSQVVGGKWWNPQAESIEVGSGSLEAPVFDWNRPELDVLVAGLLPAYLRIGGSEADKVYYDMDSDAAKATAVPPGYESVLTRRQWDAVNAFAARHKLRLVFTLNAGPGARDAAGVWQEENARALLAYSTAQRYGVDLWELGNELNLYWFVHGLEAQVSPPQYDEDLRRAAALVHESYPAAAFAGQGSAFWPLLGEPLGLFFGMLPDYLQLSGDVTDVVSWHYYPQQGRRGPIASRRASPARLLDPANLDEAGHWAGRMRAWRDQYAPTAELWQGETGNAQFGGEPGLSAAFLASLWWLDQLGMLATYDHDVVVRQTLSGMDYGLIDDETLAPRPDYWASLLWKRLMGTAVYRVEKAGGGADKLRLYAHAAPQGDGFTLLAINLDHQRAAELALPQLAGRPFDLYLADSPDIFGAEVRLNGASLAVQEGALPPLAGRRVEGWEETAVSLPPLTYAFLHFAE